MARAIFIGGLCLLSSACGMFASYARNSIVLPKQFFDECHAMKRNNQLADIAWREFHKQNPSHDLSPHFARGFKHGYTDYLDTGGNGEPPALPPPRYQTVEYQTPQGREAVMTWFSGFRQGAEMAQMGGLRELVTVPISQYTVENFEMMKPVENTD